MLLLVEEPVLGGRGLLTLLLLLLDDLGGGGHGGTLRQPGVAQEGLDVEARVSAHRGHGLDGQRDGRGAGLRLQEANEAPQLLEGVGLHEDEVLGEQQRGDLGQLAHRGRVGVGDDGAQLVQRVVEIVHAPPLARVDVEAHQLALARLGLAPGGAATRRAGAVPLLRRPVGVVLVGSVLVRLGPRVRHVELHVAAAHVDAEAAAATATAGGRTAGAGRAAPRGRHLVAAGREVEATEAHGAEWGAAARHLGHDSLRGAVARAVVRRGRVVRMVRALRVVEGEAPSGKVHPCVRSGGAAEQGLAWPVLTQIM